ncbi:TRAP transporter small permease [Pelagibius marinus]|uniref:TRAP transporter small permease n=1 Tax=Pelagibius marinus TaxID=2762760 RepID=UPI0018723E2C|nr:TRAP transporter small permease subunit [Pelagibius marinus]
MLRAARRSLEWILEWITIILMIALSVVVIIAVSFRLVGDSLSWYDEVAAIQLSWVTYYGAALAALKRNHIGFDSVLLAIPMPARMVAVALAEITVIGFFAIMTWAGMEVLNVLEGSYLISLTWVPIQLTQSVIPIGGALFILCELISLPHYWRMTAAGISLEHAEIEEEVEHELKQAGGR